MGKQAESQEVWGYYGSEKKKTCSILYCLPSKNKGGEQIFICEYNYEKDYGKMC